MKTYIFTVNEIQNLSTLEREPNITLNGCLLPNYQRNNQLPKKQKQQQKIEEKSKIEPSY